MLIGCYLQNLILEYYHFYNKEIKEELLVIIVIGNRMGCTVSLKLFFNNFVINKFRVCPIKRVKRSKRIAKTHCCSILEMILIMVVSLYTN